MKRILLILSIAVCSGLSVFAESAAINQANKTYTQGNYALAAQQYEAILTKDGVAPEVYYNLGNAYYKSNEIGRSILNYERALRLDATFEDARVNLELAQLKVVDNVSQNNGFFIGRWIGNLLTLLSSNQWLFISVLAFVLFLLGALLFIFGSTLVFRKVSFYVAVVLLIATVTTGVFAGVRNDQFVNHSQAIIMSGLVTVKSSPDKSGTDLFQLHEGTKVNIKSTLGTWLEISLGNGGIGWVEQSTLERI